MDGFDDIFGDLIEAENAELQQYQQNNIGNGENENISENNDEQQKFITDNIMEESDGRETGTDRRSEYEYGEDTEGRDTGTSESDEEDQTDVNGNIWGENNKWAQWLYQ
ncbi:MAG: hypothetical protein EZS28_048765 [Streblomastix strix]|uniref:Uncharacterized protein n=1 Tax=Streblomastix strix TaxID=222440 RepID=A0A5J4TBS6_9EUKA|nr:MAG: hypothetical protein EZS28_048765 [Streblomastix strix]